MKALFKRCLPSATTIQSHPRLQFLGRYLLDPCLWHFNRRSLARGTALGLFLTWFPLPAQTILVAFGAVIWRANLPLVLVLVWIANPITIPPMFYLAYKLGAFLLSMPEINFTFDFSSGGLTHILESVWLPLLCGCTVLGVTFALLGYCLIEGLWRWQVRQAWQQRKLHRQF